MSEANCGNCKYYKRTALNEGRCTRFPPQGYPTMVQTAVGPQPATQFVQPATQPQGWCGEHLMVFTVSE